MWYGEREMNVLRADWNDNFWSVKNQSINVLQAYVIATAIIFSLTDLTRAARSIYNLN